LDDFPKISDHFPKISEDFRYLTCSLRSLVRYRCEHEKINSISPSVHVLFGLLYKHTNNDVFDDFPEDFRPLSADFRRFSKIVPKAWSTSPNIFQTLPEDCRRLPKVAEDFRGGTMMFRSHNSTSEYFLSDYVAIAMAILRLVTTT